MTLIFVPVLYLGTQFSPRTQVAAKKERKAHPESSCPRAKNEGSNTGFHYYSICQNPA